MHASPFSRRDLLGFGSTGLTAAALHALLASDACRAAEVHERDGHPVAKAKRVIHICLVGGLSQIDSFDHKPVLAKHHGQPLPSDVRADTFFGEVGLLRAADWAFEQRGKSGLWMSELFPHLAGVADELTVIRSMVADSANHMPAMFQENSGFRTNGYPALGSWLSYGLGNESDSLPTFVVLPDARSQPNGGASNWSSGFLPASHQGVLFEAGDRPVRNLFADRPIAADAERSALDMLARLNAAHADARDGDDLLAARIRAYELAARMQASVPEATDFADEPESITRAYGLGRPETADFGRRCLLARRLMERGVRFAQLYSGGAFGGSPRHGWDGHEDNLENHAREAAMIDQPVAALLADLRQRGMLADTLVLCTTEFGRTPFTQSGKDVLGKGRDHNAKAFSVWLAGAGLRAGHAHGATDDFGGNVVENPVTWPDFHATVLHLLGIDHERLTYYHDGIERRLTNVHGSVVRGILA